MKNMLVRFVQYERRPCPSNRACMVAICNTPKSATFGERVRSFRKVVVLAGDVGGHEKAEAHGCSHRAEVVLQVVDLVLPAVILHAAELRRQEDRAQDEDDQQNAHDDLLHRQFHISSVPYILLIAIKV